MRDWLTRGLVLATGAMLFAACGGSDDSGAFYGSPEGGAGAAGASAGTGGNVDGGAGTGGSGGSGATGGMAGAGALGGGGGASGCTSDQQCTGGVCDPLAGHCVACLLDIDCGDGRRCVDNACEAIVECGNSLDCVPTPATPICNTASGTCEECVAAADCDGDAECVDNRCQPYTPCVNSLDCAAGGQVCDTGAGKCVDCLAKADCGSEQECVGNRCVDVVTCESDNHCTPLGKLCDRTRGVCVACLRDVDCPDIYHCASNACVLDVCRQDEAQCQGNSLRECNAVGDGFITTPCGSRQSCVQSGGSAGCEDWACTAGQTYCDANTAIECSDDGLTVLDSSNCTAQNLTCVQGQCKDQLCTPDDFYCDGNQVMQCDSTGTSASVWETCSSSEYCDQSTAFCLSQICTPDQPACNGDVATTCNAQGSGYLSGGTDCSATGKSCAGGTCQTCPGGQGAIDKLRIVEVSTYNKDYVILKNISQSCPADLGGVVLRLQNSGSRAADQDFTLPSHVLAPGEGVVVVEDSAVEPGDIVSPTIFMTATDGGQVALCDGACSASTMIDALVYRGSGTTAPTPPPLPSGVTFSPDPVRALTNETTEGYVRDAFAGTAPSFLTSDWTTGPVSRPSGSTTASCPASPPTTSTFCDQSLLGVSCSYSTQTCVCALLWNCQ